MELKLIKEKCLGCGACVGICPNNALELKDGKIIWNKEKCSFCKLCKNTCPMGAIVFED